MCANTIEKTHTGPIDSRWWRGWTWQLTPAY